MGKLEQKIFVSAVAMAHDLQSYCSLCHRNVCFVNASFGRARYQAFSPTQQPGPYSTSLTDFAIRSGRLIYPLGVTV